MKGWNQLMHPLATASPKILTGTWKFPQAPGGELQAIA